jgi:hypothetical protein
MTSVNRHNGYVSYRALQLYNDTNFGGNDIGGQAIGGRYDIPHSECFVVCLKLPLCVGFVIDMANRFGQGAGKGCWMKSSMSLFTSETGMHSYKIK